MYNRYTTEKEQKAPTISRQRKTAIICTDNFQTMLSPQGDTEGCREKMEIIWLDLENSPYYIIWGIGIVAWWQVRVEKRSMSHPTI